MIYLILPSTIFDAIVQVQKLFTKTKLEIELNDFLI
jgi:hypothetical protein